MSTPAQTPYYRPRRQRSLFGPIVLMAIGIIFLLRNFGMISMPGFWVWFSNYWPLLLILLGVVRLAEYMWARQSGNAPPRMSGGAVFLLVFFIFCGLFASGVVRLWPNVRDNMGIENDPDLGDFFGGMFGTRYDFSDNFSQPVNATQLRVLANRGDITITASTDKQVHAIIQKALRSDSQEHANRLNDTTNPKLVEQGSVAILDLTGGDYQHGEFDLDLQVPPALALSVTTHHGDITVSQRDGNVELASDHGDVNVDQIKGDAAIHLRHGSVTGKNITGNVTLDGTVSDTSLSDVRGTVTLTGTYWGDLQLARIARRVHFTTSRTDLEFAALDGSFDMQPDEMSANSVTGPFRLETRSKSVHLEDVSGQVKIQDSNAPVELRPRSPLAPVDVSNRHGDIRLAVPPDAGFQLDASSIGGEIHTDFDLKADNDLRNATLRGAVGKGGPMITLHSDRGTIEVRKQ